MSIETVKAIPRGALYYPYIHVKDVNWLRANLLMFPDVARMLPMNFNVRNDGEVGEFTRYVKDRAPLLRPANLWSDRSELAQEQLASKLRRDLQDETFVKKYGVAAARELIKPTDPGFQIHTQKLSAPLREVLMAGNKLAWTPVNPDDESEGYVEVHPRIGEAIMSTLAVACAQTDGLQIVGDERSGPLHQNLLEKDLNGIYDWWLKPDEQIAPPPPASGEELMEFILGIPGDLSTLTAEKIYNLESEREAINELIEQLRTRAAKIPAMDEGPSRDEAFKDAANDTFKAWEQDKRNFRGFAREFFSMKATDMGTGFLGKVAEKVAPTALLGGAAGWLGSVAAGLLIGSGAGLAVGLVAHAGITYYKLGQREEKSPYRFLTALTNAGVVFRSEANTNL